MKKMENSLLEEAKTGGGNEVDDAGEEVSDKDLVHHGQYLRERLAPVMGPTVQRLEECEELSLTEHSREKLIRMSASTIDRLMTGERRKQIIKGRSNTKPGTLLKNQIPVRTFSDWDEQRPGFVEIDLVGHDGGTAKGEFIQTLDVTDVCTTWTETEA